MVFKCFAQDDDETTYLPYSTLDKGIDSYVSLKVNTFIAENTKGFKVEILRVPNKRLKYLMFDEHLENKNYCAWKTKGYRSEVNNLESVPYLAYYYTPGLITAKATQAHDKHLNKDGFINIDSAMRVCLIFENLTGSFHTEEIYSIKRSNE
ncbi:hypothetical protein [Aliikangiella maris]|uniref:Uncharacterized protein n=2 Tax=Aliikangiella maris TaxID=3162458 RepID=A0ABV2BZM0_9GAMM